MKTGASSLVAGAILLMAVTGCKNVGLFGKVVRSCNNLKERGYQTVVSERKGEREYVCQVAGTLKDDGGINIDPELSKNFKDFNQLDYLNKPVLYRASVSSIYSHVKFYIRVRKKEEDSAAKEVFARLADEVLRKEVDTPLPEAVKNKILNDPKFMRETMQVDGRYIYISRNANLADTVSYTLEIKA